MSATLPPDQSTPDTPRWPQVSFVGLDGILVSFADNLNEPANRAALAFRMAVERASWPWVSETTTSLVSVFVRWSEVPQDDTHALSDLQGLLAKCDWYAAPMPDGRKLWRIPTVFGSNLAPQLAEAAAAAGQTPSEAISAISSTNLRVQTIGFAPGQPYLGELPEPWNIPRQTDLTGQVPVGALVVAIRQLTLFSVSAPTGWWHIGQTAAKLFRPQSPEPFMLRPGDEVRFAPCTETELANIAAEGGDGASWSSLA